jgi:hypothetical protein
MGCAFSAEEVQPIINKAIINAIERVRNDFLFS